MTKTYKAGFDLTDISANHWNKLCEIFGLYIVPNDDVEKRGFVWKDENGNRVVTYNNPITGEYFDDASRPLEVGYASSIGIEGTLQFTNDVFEYIKDNADEIKYEIWGSRDFI